MEREPDGSETPTAGHAPAFSCFQFSDPSSLSWLLHVYNAAHESPLAACLQTVDSAHSLVVEHEYYDPDYRSEFSEFHSRSFEQFPQHTDRLHFFAEDVRDSDVYALSQSQSESYLGYIVVRPGSAGGTVGRAMLSPPTTVLVGGTPLAHLVRTAVKERVTFFGQSLDVVGAPFMQQDSRSLRCAHVAAWMCHYTAALRGFVPRRLTSHLHDAGAELTGRVRPFPSEGLSEEQLAHLLSFVGLPAHRYDIPKLNDRHHQPPADNDDHKVWHNASGNNGGNPTEKIRTHCARYLNSGIPVLATVGGPSGRPHHVVAIVGQGRVGAEKKTMFIYHDDEKGPYRVCEDPASPQETRDPRWLALYVPLPEKVWMLGEHAERAAEQSMFALASTPEAPETMTVFRTRMLAGGLGVRSYVIPSSEFKRSIRQRLGERREKETRAFSQARMSRFVWVVEVFLRDARDQDDDLHVLGEVVIDSTASDPREGVLVEHFGGLLRVVETSFVPFARRYEMYELAVVSVLGDRGHEESPVGDERQQDEIVTRYVESHLTARRQTVLAIACDHAPYESGRRTIGSALAQAALAPSNGFTTR